MTEIERVASALREPTRRRILLAFLDDPRPRTVDEVAELAGVHRTVAFNHLERLLGLGYLAGGTRRGVPGKPAKVYRPAGRPLELSHPQRRFGELAGLLARALAGLGPEGAQAAHAAGVAHASELGDLEDLGADYEVGADRITARNCVFLEACDRARPVVCGLHAGLLEGALRGRGLKVQVLPGGRVGPAGCTFLCKENP